jgi:hypothetical protein
MDKPLPLLPVESFLLAPAPHRFHPPMDLEPRSHFSTSTMSTTMSSPTQSQFEFGSSPSLSDSLDDVDLTADTEGSGDEFMHTLRPQTRAGMGFHGYSLPDGDYASEQTLRKETPVGGLSGTLASRTTFGGAAAFESQSEDVENLSALEQLLNELGYLGGVIVK